MGRVSLRPIQSPAAPIRFGAVISHGYKRLVIKCPGYVGFSFSPFGCFYSAR